MTEDNRDITAIGIDMVDAGLSSEFVSRILELAQESEGVEDLVHLWAGAPNDRERKEVESDLREAIADREPRKARRSESK